LCGIGLLPKIEGRFAIFGGIFTIVLGPRDRLSCARMERLSIRPVSTEDDLESITRLIRAAYAKHAGNNLRYWATHQSVADTARRFGQGCGLVAEMGGTIVGTVTVRPPNPESSVTVFRDPATWTVSQFAVSPDLQGRGIGRRLLRAAAEHAQARGGRVLTLDTAAPALELIEMYQRWGYRVVGECDWRPKTNYLSVVMTCPIAAEPEPLAAESPR
jgi:ribosomal protein S18 acetylase RimI-like enzyme